MHEPHALLILPRLHVQNANAISSPLTWGFPAPSAFTGFVHALGRRAAGAFDLQLEGVGIVCHQFEPQVFNPAGKRTKVFRLTRNPVDKDGKTAAIVEEGRAHFDVSLVIGVRGDALWDGSDPDHMACRLLDMAHGMRLAGGSILPGVSQRVAKPELVTWPEDAEGSREASRRLRRRLLPGFALVERQDLLTAHRLEMSAADAPVNALDALLDLVRLNVQPQTDDTVDPPTVEWKQRPRAGWLVPIPLGYAAISPLYAPGVVTGARDDETPFRFVESALGLGQWISPHRIDDLRHILWYHRAEPEAGLYRCTNMFSTNVVHA